MADLTAKFRLVDEMSDKLASMAQSGQNMVAQFERAGETMSSAFNESSGSMTAASGAVDGVASSVVDLRDIVEEGAKSFDDFKNTVAEQQAELEHLQDAYAGVVMQEGESSEAAQRLKEVLDAQKYVVSENTKELENLEKQAGKTGDGGMQAIEGVSSALAAAGVTAMVKEITESVYALSEAFSEAESIVVKATGATGEALDGLTSSMMSAYAASKGATLDDTAAAIGEINTRMGLTGDALTDVTGKFLDFSQITGTDVVGSVQSVTKIMNKWNIEGENVESVLDKLAYAGQVSGISVSSLATTVTNSSATFQALGLDLDNTIALLAGLELYGTNSATAVTGLRTAVNKFTKDGLDAEEALRDVITQIAEMEDATAATALAVETFGSRAGQEMAGAIRSGAISIDTISKSLDVAAGTLNTTANAAETLEQKWVAANNSMESAFTQVTEPAVSKVSGAFADLKKNIGDFLIAHPGFTKAIVAVGTAFTTAVVGVTAFVTVTKVVIPLVKTLGVAMTTSLGVWGLVAVAVVAVVAAVVSLVAMYSKAESETDKLTVASREQYEELNSLNAEYEEACRIYGETSDEALALKYQVDDLSETYAKSRMTLAEFYAGLDDLHDKHTEIIDSYNATNDGIRENEVATQDLIKRLTDLADASDGSVSSQMQMESIVARLNKMYPELGINISDVNNNLDGLIDRINTLAGVNNAQTKYENAAETYAKLVEEETKLREATNAAWDEYLAAGQKYVDAGVVKGTWDELWGTGVAKAYDEAEDYYERARKDLQENLDKQAECIRIMEEYGEMVQGIGDKIVSYEDAVAIAISQTKDELTALAEEYEAAYNAAISSVEGQYKLWDQVSVEITTSIEEIKAAMDSQTQYWQEYAANLENLTGRGITGLDAMVASMDDGSEESAAALAAMASASDDELKAMVKSFESLREAQQKTANDMAELETDFSDRMAEIEATMEKAIDNMNMEDDAAAAAKKTIQAYIDQIKSMEQDATSAAESLAAAMAKALSSTYTPGAVPQLDVSTAGIYAYADPQAEMMRRYEAAAAEAGLPTGLPTAGMQTYQYGLLTGLPQHATGTTSAENAFIAGEDGPELIVGKQGSEVFPASETNRIIDALNDRPLSVMPEAGNGNASAGAQEKKIVLEVAGNGTIEVNGNGTDKESILEVLQEQIKPVLMNIIQTEIYEEGQLAYDY